MYLDVRAYICVCSNPATKPTLEVNTTNRTNIDTEQKLFCRLHNGTQRPMTFNITRECIQSIGIMILLPNKLFESHSSADTSKQRLIGGRRAKGRRHIRQEDHRLLSRTGLKQIMRMNALEANTDTDTIVMLCCWFCRNPAGEREREKSLEKCTVLVHR